MIPGRAFYDRPTLDVLADLIGKVLVHTRRGVRASGVIVEAEAYIGETDPACHAAPGPTARNAPLYGPAGQAYVYLNYGLHYLVNAVTEREGFPAAVLIRALEPIDGIAVMRRRRAIGRRVGAAPVEVARSVPRTGQFDDGPRDRSHAESGQPDRRARFASRTTASRCRRDPGPRASACAWARGRCGAARGPDIPRCPARGDPIARSSRQRGGCAFSTGTSRLRCWRPRTTSTFTRLPTGESATSRCNWPSSVMSCPSYRTMMSSGRSPAR